MLSHAKAIVKGVVRRALVPLRRVVGAAVDRFPALESRVSGWSWLWQPGWSRRHHERFYGERPDPYGFESDAEQTKYRETLALLADRRYARALEVGASEGAFTELLLPHCDELVATDVSEVALARAHERLGERPGLTLERRPLPFDFPEGTFDLIVCSDVLYFWDPETLDRGLDRLAQRLRPGGRMLLVHYNGTFGQPVTADTVHDRARAKAAGLGLEVVPDVTMTYRGPHDAGYLADVLVRPSA